ncbi:MRN complex-interacting protein isoform X2 [Dicentrarchus labrax]|uniref:MRN complex-interacting protein isoform X2 n=1 Tax=Dicentrarchus labrax TaxID=13489 RepID=UPI0021F66245|nr:MRN complex-interacting protein isoform X2 [Dicentrarchus labrax]XP_051276079.1 MRN complex-interacting protein isoform X2 [Dicentrarchus labrax]
MAGGSTRIHENLRDEKAQELRGRSEEFGRGSGADCRRHVQKLNAMRGVVMEEQEHNTWSLWKQTEADGEDEPEVERDPQVHTQMTHTQVSCWSKYLDTPEEVDPEEEENVLMERQKLHGNNMIDRKRRKRRTDSWIPEMPNWSSLNHINPPSKRDSSPPSLNHLNPPSKRDSSPPSLNHINPPSKRDSSPPSLNHINPPRKRDSSPPCLNHINPPSKRDSSPPSKRDYSPPSQRDSSPPSQRGVGTDAVSRWAQFLSSDCQVSEEEEEPAASGRSQSVGRAASLSCNVIITPPSSRPRPLLPVSSMFQSGDEFNFDDDFLND